MRFRHLLLAAAIVGALGQVGLPALAASEDGSLDARISELEAKVRRLEALVEQQYRALGECARVEELEEALASCVSAEEVEEALAESEDHPTLYDETEIKVGGYVKMDVILSDYSNAPTRGVGEDFFIPETIATAGESGDPRLNFHAKETRYWLKSFTPTSTGCPRPARSSRSRRQHSYWPNSTGRS